MRGMIILLHKLLELWHKTCNLYRYYDMNLDQGLKLGELAVLYRTLISKRIWTKQLWGRVDYS